MATAQRQQNGTFTAVWRDATGKRVSIPTGETLMERALSRAQAFEAEARFWEDQGTEMWQRLADVSYSPRYLHSIFIARAHMPFPTFKRLLVEAGVKFKASGSWRDRTRPRGKVSEKTWKLNGKDLTIDELMEHAKEGLTRPALRFRLDRGWDVEKAVSTPLLSRSESGLLGANVSNKPRKEAA